MARILVVRESDSPLVFSVGVEEDDATTEHTVTITNEEMDIYGEGMSSEELVRATFAFLLERESKDKIQEEFSLSDVERSWPEYSDLIQDYCPV